MQHEVSTSRLFIYSDVLSAANQNRGDLLSWHRWRPEAATLLSWRMYIVWQQQSYNSIGRQTVQEDW